MSDGRSLNQNDSRRIESDVHRTDSGVADSQQRHQQRLRLHPAVRAPLPALRVPTVHVPTRRRGHRRDRGQYRHDHRAGEAQAVPRPDVLSTGKSRLLRFNQVCVCAAHNAGKSTHPELAVWQLSVFLPPHDAMFPRLRLHVDFFDDRHRPISADCPSVQIPPARRIVHHRRLGGGGVCSVALCCVH